jgi:hypothetical protein
MFTNIEQNIPIASTDAIESKQIVAEARLKEPEQDAQIAKLLAKLPYDEDSVILWKEHYDSWKTSTDPIIKSIEAENIVVLAMKIIRAMKERKYYADFQRTIKVAMELYSIAYHQILNLRTLECS